ncbi:uncharacterized protein LOC108218212 [Daucus carota subsp. sativus]|uniref:uncharacterized protein LOC108218212 n=1 Tax=Daucus carota subsp. sativus TaxID=79200 RepID=UPI003082C511
MVSLNFISSLSKNFFTYGLKGLTISDRYISVVPVRGCSMSPTFNPHCSTSLEGSTDDSVLVEKFCLQKYEFSLGDVIVFCSPNDNKEKCVKRITALPGYWVSSPFSNDVVKIPDGHCWVEGDNSASSLDSRSIGPVCSNPYLLFSLNWGVSVYFEYTI